MLYDMIDCGILNYMTWYYTYSCMVYADDDTSKMYLESKTSDFINVRVNTTDEATCLYKDCAS